MNENTLNSFRYGGIAHIFAVSGLHIGVLYGVITAIFKRVHGNKYLTAGAKIGIIAFYAGVCGFTPSSVRAVIMCAVAAVCKLTYQKYDSLNALSFAVIILLLINPLYLFGTGFILSVLAVLGIIFLSERYKKLFGGIPQKLNEGIAVSLAAQTTTFPALLLVFGYVSGAGMLLNMIVLPILSMLYVIIFCGAIVCSIFPFAAAYVMPVLCRPLDIVINLALSSGLENSILSGFGGVWLALVLLVVVIAVTDKVNIKLTFRTVTSSLMAVVFSFMVVAESVVPSSTLLVTACAYYGGGMVIVRSTQGTVVVVTEELITNTVFCNLSKNNVKGVDEVIILGGDVCLHQYYELNLSVANMYLSPQLISVDSIGDCVVHYQQSFSLYGVNYTLTDSYSLVADYNGATFAVCAGESINVTSADVLYTVYQNTACNADMVVYFNKIDGVYCQYNIYDCGNLHFTAKDGKMIFNQIIPNAR
jgi:ComEC/Rec2-related protein